MFNEKTRSGIKSLFFIFIAGIVVMLGMRTAEYLIQGPPVKLLICISDADGNVGSCKDFEEFTKEAS